MVEDRVQCRTPDGGKPGTNMPREKFEALEAALREILAQGPMKQSALEAPVTAALRAAQREMIGSVRWHMTWVRLEMEVRGDLRRLPGSPVRVALAGGDET